MMEGYFLSIGYGAMLLAIGLLAYRWWWVLTGNKQYGVVTQIIVKNTSLSGAAQSKHLEIAYKNAKGTDCTFVADNGLLVFFYKIGAPIKLCEKKGKVIVSSWFNLLAAPTVLFLMGAVILVFMTG